MYDLKPFWFWCQKVLPLVYDDSLSYYEVLCKVMNYMNKIIENNMEIMQAIAELGGDVSLELDYVTPEMYGAKGDGVQDDYEAVQAAFRSGKNVCFMKDKTYRITKPIYIEPEYNSYRSCFCKTINNTEYYSIKADFDPENGAYDTIFFVSATAYTFYNVSVLGRNQNPKTIPTSDYTPPSWMDSYKFLTVFKLYRNAALTHNADMDFQMINCNTSNAKVVCDFTGRGCKIDGHVDVGSNSFLKINWEGDNASGAYHDDAYGQRAVSVTNCRFHAEQSASSLINVQSGNVFAFRFLDNLIDRGYNNFINVDSDIDGWLISNNVVVGEREGSNGSCLIWFGGDVSNLSITNNKFINGIERQDTAAFKPNNLIQFGKTSGEHSNVLIANNTVNKLFNGNLIYVPSGTTFTDLNVSGNNIGIISDLSAHRALVRGSGLTLNKSVVNNNSLGSYTQGSGQSGNRVCAVYSASGLTMAHCKVMGNALGENFSYMVDSTGTESITYSIVDLQSYTTASNDDNTSAEPMIP